MRIAAASALFVIACAEPAASAGAHCRERVVSLHDVTTEAVLRFDGAACLVGVAEPTDLDPALRAQLAEVRRVEGAESVLAVRPTQVLALAIVAEEQPALFRELDRRSVRWLAPRLAGVADVAQLARTVAERIDRRAAAAAVVERLSRLQPTAAGARARVFVFDCCAPPFTAGKQAVITDLLAHAGAENVFADVDDDWFNASWEAVVARSPELIVIDDYGEPDNVAKKRAVLAGIAPLAKLPVVVLPLRDALGTIRSAEVVQQLAASIARSRSRG
jgi:ABC-type Fe3+-hydroxamate transport system substrate-binding protein